MSGAVTDRHIQVERAQNLWSSFERKFEPVARGTSLHASPDLGLEEIGGLAGPKEEVLTYACASTNPEVYSQWGTFPPSGLLLIGESGVGKTLLARALATRTETAFLHVNVPRLVLEIVHGGGKVGELVAAWSQTHAEMPPLTVLFDELEFSQAQELGARRPDLPVGPVMDFLLDIVDRTIDASDCLVVGATSHPDTLRQAFLAPGRFERVVEVSPVFPDDIIEALQIHASSAEKRAGRTLFDPIDWTAVVGEFRISSTGEWIRIMHAVLRRKARGDATGETVTPVTTQDLIEEVERYRKALTRLAVPGGGTYV